MALSVQHARELQNILNTQKSKLSSVRSSISSQANAQDLDPDYASHMRAMAGIIGSVMSAMSTRIDELELIINPPQPPSGGGGGGNPGP